MGVNFKFNTGGFAEGSSTATGNYSHAEGAKYENNRNTESAGNASHAEGASTYAKADGSHAEGILNIAGRFLDEISTAAQELGISGTPEELGAKLLGYGAHAEGMNNEALGSCSHAEGHTTKALANSTHAEGDSTLAFGEASHAEGYNTQAKGNQSHTEGSNTIAIGNSSHAEGVSTTASGSFSHAEGSHTEAIGRDSHAEGAYNKAIGIASHAEGDNNIAPNAAQHVSGKFATVDETGTSIFKVGIGTSTDDRRDALNISTNGEFTFGDALGNYVVLNTTLLQRLKDLVDIPYSFSYAWDYANPAGGTVYFDTDWRTTNRIIRDNNSILNGYDGGYLVSPTEYDIIHNEYSSEEPDGLLTFSEPITTFPTLFYHLNGYEMYLGFYLPVIEITIPDKVKYIPDRCFCRSGLDIFFENSKSIKEIGIAAFEESLLCDSILDLSNVSLFCHYALAYCGHSVNKVCIDSRKATFMGSNVFFILNNSAELVDLNPDANVILDTNSGNVEIINGRGDTVYSGTFREEGGSECVAPGTKILVDSIGNTKNVEDLQVGDIVLTQDGDLYIEAILDKVITKDHYHYSILTLEDDSTLTISRDHAVLTTDGWKAINPILTELPKEAKWLTDKDTVITRTGTSKIKNIEHKHLLKNPMIMYNLGVSGYYNYFANNVCVYECSGSE